MLVPSIILPHDLRFFPRRFICLASRQLHIADGLCKVVLHMKNFLEIIGFVDGSIGAVRGTAQGLHSQP